MDLDSIYLDRTSASSRYRRPSSDFRSRYGSGRISPTAHYGPYSDPYRSYQDVPAETERRYSATRRVPPPPPPPPPPPSPPKKEEKEEKKQKTKDRKKAKEKRIHHRKKRSPSTTESEVSTATISSSTSENTTSSSGSSRTSGYTSRSRSGASSSSSSPSTSDESDNSIDDSSRYSSSNSDSSPTTSSSTSLSRSHSVALSRSRTTNNGLRKNDRLVPARTPSVADLESAAAAAAEAILRKERDLKQKELELLSAKQSFARDVRRHVSATRGFETEDEAITRMQRLVALEDTTPSLHDYIRRTAGDANEAATPRIQDAPAAASQSLKQSASRPDVIGKGPNRMSGYQPSALRTSRLLSDPGTAAAGEDDALTAPSGSRTPTLVLRGPQQPKGSGSLAASAVLADSGPAVDGPTSVKSGSPGVSMKDTPPPSRVRGVTGVEDEAVDGEGDSAREVDVRSGSDSLAREETTVPDASEGGVATSLSKLAKSMLPTENTEEPVTPGSPDPADSPDDSGRHTAMKRRKVRVPRKSASRPRNGDGSANGARTGEGNQTPSKPRKLLSMSTSPVRQRLTVRVRRPSRARPRSRSVATETDKGYVVPFASSEAAVAAPQRSVSPRRELLSPEAPQSRFVSPQPDSSPRNLPSPPPQVESQQQLVPVLPQLYNPSASQPAGQPWALTAINWPLKTPPQTATPSAALYTASTSGPMTNKEFKNLLCSEYVPPEGAPPPSSPRPTPGSRSASGVVLPSQVAEAKPQAAAKGPPPASTEDASSWEDVESPQNVAHTAGRGKAPRGDYEPFAADATGAGRPSRSRARVGGQQVDGSGLPEEESGGGGTGSPSDADLQDPDVAPPPPPGGQPEPVAAHWASHPDDESVVEFPPPPQFTVPDMPGPGRDDGSDGEPECCSCCTCFTRLWQCLFPCCCRTAEEKEARRAKKEERRRRVRNGSSGNANDNSNVYSGYGNAHTMTAAAADMHTPPNQLQAFSSSGGRQEMTSAGDPNSNAYMSSGNILPP